jgi:ribulose-5-phosphate 4-epimerase/fuculose-1-phosphate aldolase
MASSLDQLWCTLIAANHILDYFSLVTGYGHISARNPLTNPTLFFDPVDPPSLITSNAGYLEWNVSNGAHIGSRSVYLSPSSEIWIHQAIYKRYPNINSVVHSHSRAVLPFADTDIPLVPQFNLEAVLGAQVPVFDIADYYAPNESHNFLVNLPHLGAALADTFSTPENNATKQNNLPYYPVVLQRAHGLSAAATSIEHAVWAAWSAQDAANVASNHSTVLGAYRGRAARLIEFSEQELRDSMTLGQSGHGLLIKLKGKEATKTMLVNGLLVFATQ